MVFVLPVTSSRRLFVAIDPSPDVGPTRTTWGARWALTPIILEIRIDTDVMEKLCGFASDNVNTDPLTQITISGLPGSPDGNE